MPANSSSCKQTSGTCPSAGVKRRVLAAAGGSRILCRLGRAQHHSVLAVCNITRTASLRQRGRSKGQGQPLISPHKQLSVQDVACVSLARWQPCFYVFKRISICECGISSFKSRHRHDHDPHALNAPPLWQRLTVDHKHSSAQAGACLAIEVDAAKHFRRLGTSLEGREREGRHQLCRARLEVGLLQNLRLLEEELQGYTNP